ncbi:MAG: OmpA family protein [Bacteroidota bacterium]
MSSRLIKALLVLFLSSGMLTVSAQTSQNPWMAGLSASFLDYQGPLTGDITQYQTFRPGISMGAHGYINQLMNFSVNTTFVPQISYPTSETNFISTSLLDVNSVLQFKSNGTIFDEEAFFAPYIAAGFGLNTASNNLRLYIPAALGFRFRISNNFRLQLESMYKQGLGTDNYQHLSHSVGFVFALPAPPRQVEPRKPKSQDKVRPPVASANDLDGDGVPNDEDLCPNIKGLAMYLGCPEEQQSEEVAGATAFNDPKPKAKPTRPEPVVKPAPVKVEPVPADPEPEERITYSQPTAQEINFVENLAVNNVYFQYASDEFENESFGTLDQLAEILKSHPNYKLKVMGHTDNTGPNKDNIVLSIKRAYRVKYYLVYEKGIKMNRIISEGYSSSAPVNDNGTEAGRARNRRVEFKLIKVDSIGFQNE